MYVALDPVVPEPFLYINKSYNKMRVSGVEHEN